MATEAALKALSNSQLASGAEIPASKHRTVNDAIIEELFDAQSRGDVLSGVQAALAIAAGDKVLVIRGGQAYLLDADEFGFIDTLAGLTDVNIPTPSNDQILAYDFGTSQWVAKDLSAISTGGDITGSGTINAIPKFATGTSITDSNITDDGTNVSFGILAIFPNGITISNVCNVTDSGFFVGGNNGFRFNNSLDTFNNVIFRDNGDVYVRGDLGIGVLTPSTKLDIDGVVTATGGNSTQWNTAYSTSLTTTIADLGTNQTAIDVASAAILRVRAGLYNANTTLTLSNVSNLEEFRMQITNTNANVLTFAGITVYFKSDDLPTGVTFGSNALTFPGDTAVKYNIVGIKFDGSTFDCKIEIR